MRYVSKLFIELELLEREPYTNASCGATISSTTSLSTRGLVPILKKREGIVRSPYEYDMQTFLNMFRGTVHHLWYRKSVQGFSFRSRNKYGWGSPHRACHSLGEMRDISPLHGNQLKQGK